jgi:hypothetical protein
MTDNRNLTPEHPQSQFFLAVTNWLAQRTLIDLAVVLLVAVGILEYLAIYNSTCLCISE